MIKTVCAFYENTACAWMNKDKFSWNAGIDLNGCYPRDHPCIKVNSARLR
jgi:hypothetical protein